MTQDISSRDALTSRILPQMTLSDASNPLTAPLIHSQDPNLTPAEKATKRFAVKGNAIVTGGAGNLGLEAARALLEHGSSNICLFDISSSFLSSGSVIATLRGDFPGARILCKNVDVTDHMAVTRAVEETARELGSVDILMCFAGVVGCKHAADMGSEEWRRVLDVNATGTWFCAQAAGKQMIEQATGGSIVFIASISGHRVNYPQPQVSYNASKAAVLQLKSSLAAEWARYGIRVNSISPGYMDTILNAGEGLEEAKQMWMERNPMGRMGDPTELTGAVVFLCSPAGKYINGADIVVDGGGSVF